MGLLKHVVMPFFSALHAFVVVNMMLGRKKYLVNEVFGWPPSPHEDFTLWEEHCLGIITGCHSALLYGCLMGVFLEHGHYRATVAAMELIFWGYGGYNAMRLGFACEVAYGFGSLAVVGLIAHAFEPGLFTKDKNKTKKP